MTRLLLVRVFVGRNSGVSWGLVLCLAFLPSTATAQLCAGQPSFATGVGQVNVSASFTGNTQELGAGFAGGRTVFGGGGFGFANSSEVDGTLKSFVAGIGADLPMGSSRKFFFCPTGRVGFHFGQLGFDPIFADRVSVDTSAFSASVGGNVGILAAEADVLSVVPTFGLHAEYLRLNAKFLGAKETESDTNGVASLGVGLIFGRTVGITPGISIPFGVSNPDVAFSLSFAINFGG